MKIKRFNPKDSIVKTSFINSSILLVAAYLFAGCASQSVLDTPIDPQGNSTVRVSETNSVGAIQQPPPLITVGDMENVSILPEDLSLEAIINTSVETSMLAVVEQAMFSQKGERWVRFVVKDPKTKKRRQFKRPLSRITRVKGLNGKAQDKLVVSLQIKMGELDLEREFILADGKHLDYPVVIGKNYLFDKALVDVRQPFLLTGGH